MVLNIDRIKFFLLFLCLIISFYNLKIYEGSKFIFFLFNILLIVLAHYGFKIKIKSFNFFLTLFFFLGFWFKYNFSLLLNDGFVFDSGIQDAKNIDKVLIYASYLTFTIQLAMLISDKFIDVKYNKKLKNFSFIEFLIYNKINLVFFSFFVTSILLSILNYKYQLVFKGFVFNENEGLLLINFFIKWFYYFGLGLFSALIINDFEKFSFQHKVTLFISLLLLFSLWNISVLSRSMVITSIYLIYILLLNNNLIKIERQCSYVLLIVFIFFILSVFSAHLSNIKRIKILNNIKDEINQNFIKKKNNTNDINNKIIKNKLNFNFQVDEVKYVKDRKAKDYSIFLIINRWVGIDSFINVLNSNNLSFKLLKKSFYEEKNINENTFYEKNFGFKEQKLILKTDKIILKGNTLPGLFSFLMYSGNIYFVCILTFILVLVCNKFEKFLILFSRYNFLLSSFIMLSIVLRIFSFGYAPKDTYLFFLSIIICLLIIKVFYSQFLEKILKSFK